MKFKKIAMLSAVAAIGAIGCFLACRTLSDGFAHTVAARSEIALPPIASRAQAIAEEEPAAEAQVPLDENQSKAAAKALREKALELLRQKAIDRDSQELYAEAYSVFEEAAQSGSVEALKDMAYMIERGLGIGKDPELALEYLMQAASLGDADAMLQVGDYLDGGRGVRKNYLLAAEWYAEAAASGVSEASARLGQLYAAGRGVEQDYAKAVELYKAAAEGGSRKGDLYLGLAYLEGWGVDADAQTALSHMQRAAEAGDPQAQYALYKLYSDGKHVAPDESLAMQWLERSVLGGDDDSLRALLAADGSRGEQLLEAIDLMGGLADSESAAASYELAKLSLKHDKSPSGIASAIALAESAAENGDRRAQLMLATVAAKLEENPQLERLTRLTRSAEDWLAEGASLKDPRSTYALRLMEREGYTVSQAVDAARKASKEDIYLYGAKYGAEATAEGGNRSPVLSAFESPRYPEGLELQDFAGRVVVELVISESGEVAQSRVVNREHPELEEAALAAVSQWKFEPGLRDGQPSSSVVRIPVKFSN